MNLKKLGVFFFPCLIAITTSAFAGPWEKFEGYYYVAKYNGKIVHAGIYDFSWMCPGENALLWYLDMHKKPFPGMTMNMFQGEKVENGKRIGIYGLHGVIDAGNYTNSGNVHEFNWEGDVIVSIAPNYTGRLTLKTVLTDLGEDIIRLDTYQRIVSSSGHSDEKNDSYVAVKDPSLNCN